ncbi:MAG: hypothetical protein OQJ97_14280 [Rhodospirillales bacterium]|nr:hypothetical protein [Rhodospirillales bacterium]
MTGRKGSGLDLGDDPTDSDGLKLDDFKPKEQPPSRADKPNLQSAEEAGFTTRHAPPKPAPAPVSSRVDGRSLRTTNRTTQLNIACCEETRERFWTLAHAAGVQAGEDFLIRLMDAFMDEKQ